MNKTIDKKKDTRTLSEKRRDAALKSAEKRRQNGAKKDLEKMKVLEAIEQQIMRKAGKIIEVQMHQATGYHKMVVMEKVEGVMQVRTVTNQVEFDDLLDNGVYGEDYFIVAASKGDWKAGNALLDRALGKATEKIEVTGKDGQPMIIKLDS